jgi:hypothetical protein
VTSTGSNRILVVAAALYVIAVFPVLLIVEDAVDGPRIAIVYAGLACGLIAAGAAPLGRFRYLLLLSWPVISVAIDALTAIEVLNRPTDDWVPVSFGLPILLPLALALLALGAAGRRMRARRSTG